MASIRPAKKAVSGTKKTSASSGTKPVKAAPIKKTDKKKTTTTSKSVATEMP